MTYRHTYPQIYTYTSIYNLTSAHQVASVKRNYPSAKKNPLVSTTANTSPLIYPFHVTWLPNQLIAHIRKHWLAVLGALKTIYL